jgi:hypothetical protein
MIRFLSAMLLMLGFVIGGPAGARVALEISLGTMTRRAPSITR